MKILIVDDCSTTRRLLALYLKSKGYEVATAENGLDGIEKVGRESVNLVLTDLNMPYMDGLEFVKSLRANPDTQGLPVVMITTEADLKEKELAMKAGANRYLTKPVTAEKLAETIRELMEDFFNGGGGSHV